MITPIDVQVYRDHLQEKLAERSIPDHLWPGLLAYFTERRRVGSFLTACLENNLQDAMLRAADPATVVAVKGIVEFLCWHVPSTSWGSPDAVHAWLAETGPAPTPFD
jgi:hypothetical protein